MVEIIIFDASSVMFGFILGRRFVSVGSKQYFYGLAMSDNGKYTL
jgi:hypothetical protein